MKASLLRAALCAVLPLLILGACASAPQPLQGQRAFRVEAVGTLATNACEAQIAADYTAVIVARRKAASDLQAKRIDVQRAERVQQLADAARAQLDAACPGGKPDAQRIAAARSLVAKLKE